MAVLYNEVEYYYVKNLQGDILGMVDASGAWVVEYSYDAETEMYYLGSRYYSPEIGRFISADDINILDVEPMKLTCKNLYNFCDNNPISKTDCNGELPLPVIGAGIGALTYLVSTAITGDEFSIIDLGMAAAVGALGGAKPLVIKNVTINMFVASITLDSVYVAFAHYRESEEKNIFLSFAAGLANASLALGSISGMATLTDFCFIDGAMQNMIDFSCGFGNNLLMDVLKDLTSNSDESKQKRNRIIIYDTNRRKQNFKEKQHNSTYKRYNYKHLAFMECRMNAF